jgi:hypothetical protein
MTQSELEKRLHALRTDDGDWAHWTELLGRGEQERRSRVRRRLLVVAVAVALLAVPTIAIAFARGDFLSITATEEDVPPPVGETKLGYTIGDELRPPGSPPVKLADSVLAPFLGKRAALVVPSPGGTQIAYHAWEEDGPEAGTPVLRIVDTATSRDEVLERGAQALAWGGDGQIAYVRALVPRYENSPEGTTGGRIGHVVVRKSLDAPAVRWTWLPTEYVVEAWAGRRLLVSARPSNVFLRRQPKGGVYAFSGPRRSRRLPVADVLALSPDGRFVLGAAGPPDDFTARSRLRVVDTGTGRVAAELDLVRGGHSSGSWVGQTIILGSGIGTARALVVLSYNAGRLVLVRALKLTDDIAEATGLRPPLSLTFGQPVFVDTAAREFMVEVTLLQIGVRGTSLYLTCDRIAQTCRRGRSIEPPARWAALVYNPSRP